MYYRIVSFILIVALFLPTIVFASKKVTGNSAKQLINKSPARNKKQDARPSQRKGNEKNTPTVVSSDKYAPALESKNKVELPKVDNNTGALFHRIMLETPIGRDKTNPKLFLEYNNQNSEDVGFGIGWAINIPYVTKVNKTGSNTIHDNATYYSSSSHGELNVASQDFYRPRVDDGSNATYEFQDNNWVVKDKQGNTFRYGSSPQSRQTDSNGSLTFKWMLEEMIDLNGNSVKYEYYKDSGQIYPFRIFYTNNSYNIGIFEIQFGIDNRINPSPVSYKTAFSVITKKQINDAKVFINGVWKLKYSINYENLQTGTNLLTSVTKTGKDDQNIETTIPLNTFSYNQTTTNWNLSSWTMPNDVVGGPYPVHNHNLIEPYSFASEVPGYIANSTPSQIIDVNGDGLADIVEAFQYGALETIGGQTGYPSHTAVYLNTGSGWTHTPEWQIPLDNRSSRYTEPNQRLVFQDRYGSDIGVRLVDVNGDKLPDFIHSFAQGPEASDVLNQVFLNTGSGWELTSWSFPLDVTFGSHPRPTQPELHPIRFVTWHPPYVPNTTPFELADVNGDDLVDIVESFQRDVYQVGAVSYSAVYLNTGSGWVHAPTWVLPNNDLPNLPPNNKLVFLTSRGSDTGVRLIDVNGDGLPDFIYSKQYQFNSEIPPQYLNQVFLNTGTGWQLTSWAFPLEVTGALVCPCSPNQYPIYLVSGTAGTPSYTNPFQLVDVNGDGLVDIVEAYKKRYDNVNPLSYYAIYLNTGSGWEYRNNIVLPNDLRRERYTSPNQSVVFQDWWGADAGLRIVDVNGDEMPDIIHSFRQGLEASSILNVVFLNNTKKNSLSAIQTQEGASINVQYKSSAQYIDSNGNLLNSKLPLGLETVNNISTNNGFGIITNETYSYSGGKFYFNTNLDKKISGFQKVVTTKGKNKTTTYYHQGDGDEASTNESNDHFAKIGRPYQVDITDLKNNLYQRTFYAWDVNRFSENSFFVSKTSELEQDFDGNTTHKDMAITFTYDASNGNLLSQKNWGEVTGKANGTFSDVGNDSITKSYQYATNEDGTVFLPSDISKADQSEEMFQQTKLYYDNLSFGQLSKGNITKEERAVTPTQFVTTSKTYNSYGLIETETDGRGNTTTYTYDSFNLYPQTVANALGQTTQYEYDYSVGKPRRIITPNNTIYETIFDGLGRILEENIPNETTGSVITKTKYEYTDTPLAVSIKKTNFLNSTLAVDSYSYLDGFGKIIQERKKAENPNQYIVKDYKYNLRDLLEKESLPYFSDGVSRTSATTNTKLYTTTLYDTLDRVTSISNAVGTTTSSYDDWKLTTTDALSNQKTLSKDAFERLIKVDEQNGTEIYQTQYTYNSVGNLTNITDALGNIRNFTYDNLGRRKTAEDLHAPNDTTFGVWQFSYDDTNNVTRRVDPKNQIVDFTYDELNRLATEDFLGTDWVDVNYTYDRCTNGVGRLCQDSNSSITKSRDYNALGQVTKETSVISDSNYLTEYDYDFQGNLISLKNPDNSEVKYDYNQAGFLETVSYKEAVQTQFTPIVENLTYAPHQAISEIYFAQGAKTINTYDANELYRLKRKYTHIETERLTIQDLNYSFDSVGNIKQIRDNSEVKSQKTLYYTYDNLYRLTSVRSVKPDGSNYYTQSFSYNPLGNLTYKSDQGTFQYNGHLSSNYANPHAVTQSGNSHISYDVNGNINQSGNASYHWDYNNRLVSTTISEQNFSYGYDAEGNRTFYATPSYVTHFPAKTYSLSTDNIIEKHIFAGDLLLATIKGSESQAEVFYDHTDHLTGASVVTTPNKKIVNRLEYYPFGTTFSDNNPKQEKRKFAGHEYDLETNLSYMVARYYDGRFGKFLSQDPVFLSVGDTDRNQAITGIRQADFLADPQLANSYSYASNNPINKRDPNGQFVDTAIDVAFITYDIYKIGQAWHQNGWNGAKQELPNLGLDVVGIFVPGVTGLGEARRIVKGAEELKNIEKFTETANTAKNVVNVNSSTVKANKIRGDAFRDEIAKQLTNDGRIIQKEVVKNTPIGKRVMDIEVRDKSGNILGGIEAKTGNSRYKPSQRAKDNYLKKTGYPVTVIRKKL
jgi:RHS repeat-associated protein